MSLLFRRRLLRRAKSGSVARIVIGKYGYAAKTLIAAAGNNGSGDGAADGGALIAAHMNAITVSIVHAVNGKRRRSEHACPAYFPKL